MTIEDMLSEISAIGKRVELHNHKSDKPQYRWSCTVGRTMKTGYQTRDTAKRDWWRYYGDSPFNAVQAAYTEFKAGKYG